MRAVRDRLDLASPVAPSDPQKSILKANRNDDNDSLV